MTGPLTSSGCWSRPARRHAADRGCPVSTLRPGPQRAPPPGLVATCPAGFEVRSRLWRVRSQRHGRQPLTCINGAAGPGAGSVVARIRHGLTVQTAWSCPRSLRPCGL